MGCDGWLGCEGVGVMGGWGVRGGCDGWLGCEGVGVMGGWDVRVYM